MPQIQAPELSLELRDLLGITDPNPLATVSPEVVATVSLAALQQSQNPQFRGQAYIAAGGAGTYAQVAIYSPVGHVFTVQRLCFFLGGVGTLSIGLTQTLGGSLNQGWAVDGSQTQSAEIVTGSALGAITLDHEMLRYQVSASVSEELIDDWVVPTGYSLRVISRSANLALGCSFRWHE